MRGSISYSKQKTILEMQNISKSFGHIDALTEASLSVYPGEILSLVGDNGAGKSTLIKIIAGVYQIDSGSIYLNGKTVELKSAAHALSLGISTVFQDLAMVETLDVATNMFLGNPLKKAYIFVDRKKMYEKTTSLLKDLGAEDCLRCFLFRYHPSVSRLKGGRMVSFLSISCSARMPSRMSSSNP